MSAASMPIWKVPPWIKTIESSFAGGVAVLCWPGTVCARASHLEKRPKNRVQYARAVFMRPGFQTIDEKPAWQLGEACSSCFVGEGDFGFFVEDQGADEAIGVAGAWHVDSYGEDPGDPLLKIGDVGGGGTFLFESALARLLVDLAARGLQVRDRRSDDYSF